MRRQRLRRNAFDAACVRFSNRSQELTRDFVLFAVHCTAKPLMPAATVAFDRIAPIVLWFAANKWRTRCALFLVFLVYFAYLAIMTAHAGASKPASCGTGPSGVLDSAGTELNTALTGWPDAVVKFLTFPFNAIMGLAIIVIMALGLHGAVQGQKWGLELILGTVISFGLAISLFHAVPTFVPSLTDFIVSNGTALPAGTFTAPAYSSISAISPAGAFVKFSCLADSLHLMSNLNDGFFTFNLHPITALETAGAGWAAEGITYIAGGITAFELLAVKVEAPIVLAVGAVLALGIAAPMLWNFPLNYLGAVVGLGLKVVTLSVLAGLCFSLADHYIMAIISGITAKHPTGLLPHTAWTISTTMGMAAVAMTFLPNMLQRLGQVPGIPGGAAIGAMQSGGSSIGNWFMNMGRGQGGGSDTDGGGAAAADATTQATTAATDAATEAAEVLPEVILP